jgi:predicted component of type VI protein secretion system
LFASETSDAWELLRLGRLERTIGPFRFERDFSLTPLRLRAAEGVEKGLSHLLTAMEERRDELTAARQDFPLNLMSVPLARLAPLHLLVALQRFLPLLDDLSRRRTAHPYELYNVLITLYGTLRAFDAHAEKPPEYAHETPGVVFPWLFERLTTLVRESARDGTAMLPFEQVDKATYRLVFPRSFLVGKRPYLVVRGADESYLRTRLPGLLKMASPAALPPIIHSATHGVAIAVEFEPPASLPRRHNEVVYRIDVRDRLWLDVEDRLQVMLHVAGTQPTLHFALYSVTRSV